jgi:hypothetical protein
MNKKIKLLAIYIIAFTSIKCSDHIYESKHVSHRFIFDELKKQKGLDTWTENLDKEALSVAFSKQNNGISIYLYGKPLGQNYDIENHYKGGLIIRPKHYKNFINALTEAKAKYEEWVNTAKDNKVEKLYETMSIESKGTGFWRKADTWRIDNKVKLKFDFQILELDEKITYRLIIKTDEYQCPYNQYIKSDGYAFILTSKENIDDFIENISKEHMTEVMNEI